MRLPLPIGMAAAAALIGASLAPASASVVRTISHPQGQQHAVKGTSASMRGPVAGPHRFIPNKAGKGTVYTSDYGANVVYGFAPTGGPPVFQVSSGISGPQGLAATKHNLYVANTNDSQILVYTPPSTTPTLTISDLNEFPAGVAVNKKGTQVWVSNICSAPSCGMGNVEEYDNTGKLLQTITCSNLYRYYFIAVNKKGDVAVDGQNSSGFPEVDLIPSGSSSCTPLSSISLAFPGGLNFTTNGDLAVDDQNANTITTYAAPNFTTVVSTTPLNGISDPVTFAFTKGDNDLWTANAGSGSITEFPYPTGGNPIETIGGLVEPIGVAVQPPAKH